MSSFRPDKGNPLGLHRVRDAATRLMQAAQSLDASLPIYSSEMLIEVDSLQIDSASFRQLTQAYADDAALSHAILDIVKTRGKMQNPVTGSGGMLLGSVAAIGPDSPFAATYQLGDRIATLISLTATPLQIDKIVKIERAKERVTIQGHAILPARSLLAKMPTDLPEGAALAAFDICGAPLIVKNAVKSGDTVLVLGLGKAGRSIVAMLDLEFKNQIRVLGLDPFSKAVEFCRQNFTGTFEVADATNPVTVLQWVQEQTQSQGAEFVVNCANVPDTEMSTILATKTKGACLFFGMATDFQKAALGAEALAQDIVLRIGSGYTAGHADYMLNLVRRSPALYKMFCQYG